jgi:secondary thiamine-phosphate synthase enzyme
MSDLARAFRAWPDPRLLVRTETLTFRTERPVQILDLTASLAACVRASRLRTGLVNVQVLHTTAGLLLNEHEPLLLQDLERTLERLAPGDLAYRHDDLARRLPPPPPDERPNGHAHCRAMVLRASEALNVEDGALVLGRWQRVLLAELDGPRLRSVSMALIGAAG